MSKPCRIYGPDGELFALVDEIDYAWAAQWRWSPKWSSTGAQVYMRRVSHQQTGSDLWEDGVRVVRARVQRTIWLHRAILIERMGVVPPTPQHVLVDHEDRDGLNCQRFNLSWATHKSNSANRLVDGATVRRRLGL